jgi:hypothetical protein
MNNLTQQSYVMCIIGIDVSFRQTEISGQSLFNIPSGESKKSGNTVLYCWVSEDGKFGTDFHITKPRKVKAPGYCGAVDYCCFVFENIHISR